MCGDSNDSTQKYNEQCNIVVEPDCSSTCASRKENVYKQKTSLEFKTA